MALDFTALQAEVFARGFDYLNDAGAGLTRVKRWINEAMHEVDELEQWDYLLTSTSGPPPLTIADLREVASVYADLTFGPLVEESRAILASVYGPFALTSVSSATPQFWYRSAATIVGVYPNNTSIGLAVTYWKVPPDLAAGTDTPAMPDRFRQVLVEKACAKAFRDSNDPAATECLNEAARLIDEMRLALVPPALLRRPAAGGVK